MSKWDYLKQIPGAIAVPERKRTSEKELRDGPPKFRRFLRRLPCCVTLRTGWGLYGVHGAHVIGVGSGGAGVPKWEGNIIPLWWELHLYELDEGPKGQWPTRLAAFEARHRIQLAGVAEVVTLGFKNNWPPEKVVKEWKKFGGR